MTMTVPANDITKERLAEALQAVGCSARLFERRVGHYVRMAEPLAERPAVLRARVWHHMRRERDGLQLSYPEIARACGCVHSTVYEAVHRIEIALADRGAA